jgi:mycofactocin glycosyltransferase
VKAFTVVIPTRDRPRSLEACLAGLERKEGCGDFVVVVVDDGSRAADAVAAIVAGASLARLVRIDAAGSSIARNVGAREASTGLVLFLDDDCVPQRGWAAALVRAIENGAIAAAGRAVNSSRADVFGEATQVVLDYLTQTATGEDGSTTFAPTYNLACRRDLLLEMPFEESYGHAGADRDWCERIAARGHRIALARDAVVVHRQLLDFRGFLRKHYAYGAGSRRFRSRHQLGLEPPKFYAALLEEGFERGVRVGLAVCLAEAATATGYAAAALGLGERPAALAEQRLGRGLGVESVGGEDRRGDVADAHPPVRRA